MIIDPRTTLDTIKVYIVGTGAGVNNFVAPDLTPDGSPIDSSISDLKVRQWHKQSKSISEFTEGSGFSIDSGTGNIILDVDAANEDIVVIYRETDEAVSLVEYQSPFKIDTNSLNLANAQWYMLIQELFSNLKYKMGLILDSVRGLIFSASNRIIADVEDAEEDKDAVNKRTCISIVSEAISSMSSLSGISRVIKGEIADGASALTLNVTSMTKFMLFLGGATYLWTDDSPLQSGITSVIDTGTSTIVSFDNPIYGGPTEFIAMLFGSSVGSDETEGGNIVVTSGDANLEAHFNVNVIVSRVTKEIAQDPTTTTISSTLVEIPINVSDSSDYLNDSTIDMPEGFELATSDGLISGDLSGDEYSYYDISCLATQLVLTNLNPGSEYTVNVQGFPIDDFALDREGSHTFTPVSTSVIIDVGLLVDSFNNSQISVLPLLKWNKPGTLGTQVVTNVNIS